jgi:hypothetical protein
MLKKIIVRLIKFYQRNVSPFLGHNCRFYPSCSEYAVRAINKYGLLIGGIKGLGRVFKCGPWSQGGVDLP